jgi:polysaccharide export outer membrane protein
MRLRTLCQILFAIVVASCFSFAGSAQPATGPTTQNTAPAANSDDRGAAELGNAQVVTLKFSDSPQINGDYRVAPNGTISIPVIGRISIDGLTLATLEQAIAKKAAAITGRQAYVSAEISEYRPVYVTGLVNKPGAVPWRPHMIVFQAIAGAGGIQARPQDVVDARKSLDDYKRDVAALARVNTELADQTTIEVPQKLIAAVGATEAKRLIDEQQKLLDSRAAMLQSQLQVARQGKKLAETELDALKIQRGKIGENVQLARDRSAQIQQLFSKGLAVGDRSLEERLKVTDLEEKEANMSVAIVRIQAAIAQYDREIVNLVNSRHADLMTEAFRLERTIAQTRLPQTTTSAKGESRSSYGFTLNRAGSEDVETEARGSTPLFPGDVLTVTELTRRE